MLDSFTNNHNSEVLLFSQLIYCFVLSIHISKSVIPFLNPVILDTFSVLLLDLAYSHCIFQQIICLQLLFLILHQALQYIYAWGLCLDYLCDPLLFISNLILVSTIPLIALPTIFQTVLYNSSCNERFLIKMKMVGSSVQRSLHRFSAEAGSKCPVASYLVIPSHSDL